MAASDLHLCVWDDNLERLAFLLAATPALPLNDTDAKGNTPLLLAYRLGRTRAARMLQAAGADAKARTPEGFEAIQTAALTGNPDLVREAVIAYLAETDAAFERRLPALQAALAGTPDFELRMHWAFSSWIPLVSRLLPSDTFTVYKRGTSLRLDSTLLAMNGLSWERGQLSLVLQGADMPQPGSTYVLDHDEKTAADARLSFTSPQDQSQQDWVRKLLTKSLKNTDYWSRDAVFVPTLARRAGVWGGLLGALGGGGGAASPAVPRGRVSEGAPRDDDAAEADDGNGDGAKPDAEEPEGLAREDVGVWSGCGVYTLRNLCVRDTTHPPVLPEASLPLKAWWKPEYSRQVATAAEGERALAARLSSLSVAASDGAAQRKAGPAEEGDAAGAGAASTPTSAASTASSSPDGTPKAGAEGGLGRPAQAADEDDNPDARLGLLRRALCAIREGKVDALAGAQDAGELEGMYAGDAGSSGAALEGGRRVGYTVAHYSFSEYFGTPRPMPPLGGRPAGPPEYVHSDGKLHRATGAVAEFKPVNLANEDKVLDLKMAFCKEFPITLAQFMPIAEVMARTATHAANFKRFLSRKMPRGAGFPVQFSLPVFPTITATVTFEFCRAGRSPPRDMFLLPADYALGAYSERSWIRQL